MSLKSKVSIRDFYISDFSHYAFVEHNISGDVLCMLDSEGLKDVGVATIGQRLAILKSVYQIKLAHNVPIDADHYIPPCTFIFSSMKPYYTHLILSSAEAQDRENVTVERLYDIVKDQSMSFTNLTIAQTYVKSKTYDYGP